MPAHIFCGIVAAVCLPSCAAGLASYRPLKSWPAAWWVDHSNKWVRSVYRAGLFVASVLVPLSCVWMAAGIVGHFLGGMLEVHVLVVALQLAILVLPFPLAYLVYRALLEEVRTRVHAEQVTTRPDISFSRTRPGWALKRLAGVGGDARPVNSVP